MNMATDTEPMEIALKETSIFGRVPKQAVWWQPKRFKRNLSTKEEFQIEMESSKVRKSMKAGQTKCFVQNLHEINGSVRSHYRAKIRFHANSSSTKNDSPISHIECRKTEPCRRRNQINVGKVAVDYADPSTERFVSQIFLVEKKGGGLGPVINLKEFNAYLDYKHFKMEGIHMVKDMMQKGDWLVNLDLNILRYQFGKTIKNISDSYGKTVF